ncbi:hypothetical protein HG530_012539 [Fusarium avenaceum]|nr:hypothetical protein HG530_012539 [Fusarium avenaceum]
MGTASIDPQSKSRFICRLPREVRDAVYLELWRSCGLRQHIIWHEDKHDRSRGHFCRWECTTLFTVEDNLQDDIELMRVRLGTPEGRCFADESHALRLFSAWKNHWACGQRIGEVYGDDMDPGVSQSSSHGTPVGQERHCSLDFHGLRLELLENLTTLDIWVAARCTHLILDADGENLDPKPYDITNLSVGQLKQALSHLGLEKNITVSTPLTEHVEPEDGYIEHDELYPRLKIWRRGAGDLYHPVLYPIISKEGLGSSIYISEKREVKAIPQ